MRRIALRVYSVVSVAALIGLLLWLGVRLYRTRETNIEQASEHFEAIRSSAVAAYLAGGGFEADFFRQRVRSRFEEQSPLRALVLYSHDRGIQYFLAETAGYLDSALQDDPGWTGTPEYSYPGLMHQLFRAHLSLPDTRGVAMDGIYAVLPSSEVFSAFRDTLFGMLVLLFVTGIALALLSFAPAEPRAEPAASDAAEPAPEEVAQTPPETEKPHGQPNGERAEPQEAQGEPEAPHSAEAEAGRHRPGLFSPRSGLGWPEYLPKRLSFELERAASFDQDLSVVILSSPSLANDDALYADVAKALVATFTFQDLAFEYGRDAFGLILPNTSLQQALSQMESFVKSLEVKYATKAGVSFSVGIGSRNQRSVSASRLHTEVKAAWKKAIGEEGTQIIAFRSDPNRFREYLSSTA